MPDLIIADGALTARFRPDLGGRLSCLFHKGFGDLVVPMGDEAYDAWCWPKAGAFPLFPYHGGLSGPGFRYSGREVSVTANPMLALPMALHGPAQRRPWTARILGPSELSMELFYGPDPTCLFPLQPPSTSSWVRTEFWQVLATPTQAIARCQPAWGGIPTSRQVRVAWCAATRDTLGRGIHD